jgi:rod shape-determining protein MreC
MENFFSRYKNPLVLMAVLFIQIVALATQIKRPDGTIASGSGSTRLIRVWTVNAITPFERALVATGHFFRNTWRNYIDLRYVRRQNRELQEEVARMRMEQVRLKATADESQRLRALLDFKDRYVGQTLAAEIIGTSGSDSLRTITIDKGSRAGIKAGMAVITPDGIIGKVKEVAYLSSQVLLINDRESGAGVILEDSRLRGILHGVGQGELQVSDIMADEKVDIGEHVVTSGGDGVYPKGLPVGSVTSVSNDSETGPFLAVKIKSAADLDRLEEVLVVTRIAEEAPAVAGDSSPQRAAEVLAERLPSVSRTSDNSGSPTSVPPVTAKPGLQPEPGKPSVQTPGPQTPSTANTKASPAPPGAQVGAPAVQGAGLKALPKVPADASRKPGAADGFSQPNVALPHGASAKATQKSGATDGSGQPKASPTQPVQNRPGLGTPAAVSHRPKVSPTPPADATETPGSQAAPAVPVPTPDADKAKTPPSTVDSEKPPR